MHRQRFDLKMYSLIYLTSWTSFFLARWGANFTWRHLGSVSLCIWTCFGHLTNFNTLPTPPPSIRCVKMAINIDESPVFTVILPTARAIDFFFSFSFFSFIFSPFRFIFFLHLALSKKKKKKNTSDKFLRQKPDRSVVTAKLSFVCLYFAAFSLTWRRIIVLFFLFCFFKGKKAAVVVQLKGVVCLCFNYIRNQTSDACCVSHLPALDGWWWGWFWRQRGWEVCQLMKSVRRTIDSTTANAWSKMK